MIQPKLKPATPLITRTLFDARRDARVAAQARAEEKAAAYERRAEEEKARARAV